MNERQRILDLVNQGILTSEEALVLLENLAKNDQDVKSNPTETATEQTEQPTADKSAIEEKAHELTVNLSGVNRQLQDLKQAMHADQEQVTVLDTMEDLDSLSSEKATERQTLKAGLLQKQAEVDELEAKREALTDELNQSEKNAAK